MLSTHPSVHTRTHERTYASLALSLYPFFPLALTHHAFHSSLDPSLVPLPLEDMPGRLPRTSKFKGNQVKGRRRGRHRKRRKALKPSIFGRKAIMANALLLREGAKTDKLLPYEADSVQEFREYLLPVITALKTAILNNGAIKDITRPLSLLAKYVCCVYCSLCACGMCLFFLISTQPLAHHHSFNRWYTPSNNVSFPHLLPRSPPSSCNIFLHG